MYDELNDYSTPCLPPLFLDQTVTEILECFAQQIEGIYYGGTYSDY